MLRSQCPQHRVHRRDGEDCPLDVFGRKPPVRRPGWGKPMQGAHCTDAHVLRSSRVATDKAPCSRRPPAARSRAQQHSRSHRHLRRHPRDDTAEASPQQHPGRGELPLLAGRAGRAPHCVMHRGLTLQPLRNVSQTRAVGHGLGRRRPVRADAIV